jgi:hypothetical protein
LAVPWRYRLRAVAQICSPAAVVPTLAATHPVLRAMGEVFQPNGSSAEGKRRPPACSLPRLAAGESPSEECVMPLQQRPPSASSHPPFVCRPTQGHRNHAKSASLVRPRTWPTQRRATASRGLVVQTAPTRPPERR